MNNVVNQKTFCNPIPLPNYPQGMYVGQKDVIDYGWIHPNDRRDFREGYPFNTVIGVGKHQQIVEMSTNQAGCYGRNSHPYYIGKGIIENWSEMEEKKGIRDLMDDPKIKGFWIWNWGDGWYGPYFEN